MDENKNTHHDGQVALCRSLRRKLTVSDILTLTPALTITCEKMDGDRTTWGMSD